MTMTDHKAAIETADSLDALLSALIAAEAEAAVQSDRRGIEQRYGVDLSEMPTWGDGPHDTMGVYSWDGTGRFLYADGSQWVIEAGCPGCAGQSSPRVSDGPQSDNGIAEGVTYCAECGYEHPAQAA